VLEGVKTYLLDYATELERKGRYLFLEEVLGVLKHLDVKRWIEETMSQFGHG
jgi:hypothetical protein